MQNVSIFAPFVYASLNAHRWDLVIIEGWIGPVPQFINEMRQINPEVVVIHYCLDTYPDLKKTLELDVDGWFTNSDQLFADLQRIAPTVVINLAAGDGHNFIL